MLRREHHFLEHSLNLCLIYFILWAPYFYFNNDSLNILVTFIVFLVIGMLVDLFFVNYTGNMYWSTADVIDEYYQRKALFKAVESIKQDEESEDLNEGLSDVRRKIGEAGYTTSYFYDNPSFDQAIVGVDENCRVVYEYDMMIDAYVENEFSDITITDEENDDYFDACEQAMEWIEYNTIRATPYMGAMAPVIIAWNPEEEKWYNMISSEDYDINTIDFDINKEALKDYEL